MCFSSGDRIAVIGTPDQVRAAEALMQGEPVDSGTDAQG